MIIKNKKSQIGATITWIIAFLIIFFIMIIFVSFASLAGITKGVSKDYIVENFVSSTITEEAIYVLRRELTLSGKELSLIDMVKEYLIDNSKKNDLRCFFIKNSGSLLKISDYYPSLSIEGLEIASAQGKSCERAIFPGIYLPVAHNKGVSKVEIVFYNCDPLPKSEGRKPSRGQLESEISNMERNNQLYDSGCESIDTKRAMLKIYPPISEPKERTITPEENTKINEILADRININIGGAVWEFDSAKGGWTILIAGGLAFSDASYMRKNLIGEEGQKTYPDVLNALKENGVWVVPMKNVD